MKAKEYYNTIASGYNELYKEEQLKKWQEAQKLIKFFKNDVVLDVGCGTGFLTIEIAKQVKEVVGIDTSERLIEKAAKANNVKYMVADVEKLPFKNKSFDKIVSFTVLQDIEDKDAALSEMKRVCKSELLITMLKRNKDASSLKNLFSKYFKIKKFVEEEKDFIFLLEQL